MSSNDKLTPEIRFGGFTGAWEQRAWVDTVDISTEMVDPRTGDYDDLPHIGPGNIESFTGTLSNVRRVGDENLISGKFHFHCGDIVYGKIRPNLAKYVLVDFEGLASADAYVLNSKNGLEQCFLFMVLQSKVFYDYSVSVSQRTKMPKINRDELNQFKFNVPYPDEQTAIGSFFRTLDTAITLHQRKLDNLRELKRGYLQQMFPQAGERVPRVRFDGFYGDWAERQLGSISVKVSEKNKHNEFSETLTNSAEHGIISQRDFFDKDISNSKNLDGYYIVRPDDFVYNPRISNFAPVGPIKRNRLGRTGVMSPLYYVFRVIEGDLAFIEKFFESICWHEFMKMNGDNGVRSDRFNIKDSVFEEMPISFPSVAEQSKIGNFFRILDEQITDQQTITDSLKQLKSVYLQQMFV